MRQSKNHSRIYLLILILLSFILSVPKSYQLDTLLSSLLAPDEMSLFITHRAFFILLGLFLEIFGSLFALVILKYLYHFAKLNFNLKDNAIIYLFANVVTKLITLILPIQIVSRFPFISNLLFLIFFMIVHAYLQQKHKNSYTKIQWAIISAYPLVSFILGFL